MNTQTATSPTNTDDLIDSRDVIARIEELQASWSETTGDVYADYELSGDDLRVGLDDDEADELVALLALAAEASDYAPDWQYGETLIRDSYFEDYAQELAEDIGAIDHEATWPNTCIDWVRAARELRMDYTAVDFDGVTYWVR